jgi:hypothetical protein
MQTSARFQFFKLPDEKHITAAAEFEYGLTDRWELDAEVPYEFINPNDGRAANGIGDVEIATRYGVVLFSEKPYAFNAGLGLGIPTGDRRHELGEGRLTVEPSFTASRWFGPVNAQLNGRWQHAVTNGGEEPRDDFEYNVALLYPFHRWSFVLEGNGESSRVRTKYYVTPELICRATKRLELELAAPLAVTRAAGDYGVIAAVTLEWENVAHRGADTD